MVILLGGSEQDISMFLDTPRLRDEPRDEEGRDEGLLSGLHLRLHHRILGDVVMPSRGKNAPALRMTMRMPRTDCTESLRRCGGAIEGDETYQPGLIIRWVRTCQL